MSFVVINENRGCSLQVDLRSNRIGPSTAAALAHALRSNFSLTCLGTTARSHNCCHSLLFHSLSLSLSLSHDRSHFFYSRASGGILLDPDCIIRWSDLSSRMNLELVGTGRLELRSHWDDENLLLLPLQICVGMRLDQAVLLPWLECCRRTMSWLMFAWQGMVFHLLSKCRLVHSFIWVFLIIDQSFVHMFIGGIQAPSFGSLVRWQFRHEAEMSSSSSWPACNVKDKLKAMIQVDVGVCIDKLLEQNRVHKPMIAVPLSQHDASTLVSKSRRSWGFWPKLILQPDCATALQWLQSHTPTCLTIKLWLFSRTSWLWIPNLPTRYSMNTSNFWL